MSDIVIAYVPVLSENYRQFFEKHRGACLYVLGEEVLTDFPHLKKDLRALPPEEMVLAVTALGIFSHVIVADPGQLQSLGSDAPIVMPDEEECWAIAERWLKDVPVEFEPVFLRYDRKKATAETQVFADLTVTEGELHRRYMIQAAAMALKSPDWWRQVGAIVVRGSEVLFTAYNRPVPTDRETLYHGDPRANFKAGVEIEASLVLHAEAAIIAEAACRGIALQGSSLYVTTFPCAPCAKAVAYAGFRELYFRDGYSRTDGQEVLQAKGVRIVRVVS